MYQKIDEGKPYWIKATPSTGHPKDINHDPETRTGFYNTMISDFSDPRFQAAFRQYFGELGVSVSDWPALFQEMNDEGDNLAIVRTDAQGTAIGFILFKPEKFKSWFFEGTCGFVREFWVAEQQRNRGHGSAILGLAEEYFRRQGIFTSILTTDNAQGFYRKRGYMEAPECMAKNKDEVFIKRLK